MERLERVRSLVDGASPATLTTYRADGSALVTPVWFLFEDGAFEVVIAEGDPKLANLERDPRCSPLVFETVPPFRGVEVTDTTQLVRGDVTEVRAAIAGRYLGTEAGARFAAERSNPGVLVRIPAARARVWDLASILPNDGP